MWGTIIGDIVGSIYEVKEIAALEKGQKRSYNERIKIMNQMTPLFTKESLYTDNTVLTVAMADALIHDINYEKYLREYGNSLDNRTAMRVGPIGFTFDTLEQVEKEARMSAILTHNNDAPIIAAQAVASAIFLARQGVNKDKIKTYLSFRYRYNLDFDLEELRYNYTFKSSAKESVPQAIYCFLIANNFEEGLRISLSIGGDSDTIAAITCSMLEAYYGVPQQLIIQAKEYLNDKQLEVINKFYKMLKINNKEKKIIYERNS